MKVLQKLRNHSRVVGAGAVLALASVPAMADTDIASIGTTVATEIAKFTVMIAAIGTAVLSVVVLIQGFRMAFKMVKTGT